MVLFFISQVDVRRDEDQNIKLSQTIKLLIDAGYFRARVKGLSPFDKVFIEKNIIILNPEQFLPNRLLISFPTGLHAPLPFICHSYLPSINMMQFLIELSLLLLEHFDPSIPPAPSSKRSPMCPPEVGGGGRLQPLPRWLCGVRSD